jgi:hypothetical protein
MRTTFRRVGPARVVLEPVEGASLRDTLLEARTDERADRVEARAVGRVEGVRWASPRVAPARGGVLDVISLTGVVRGDDVALSLVATDDAGALVAGPLLDARVVELSLSLALFTEELPPPKIEKRGGWAEVAAASAAAQAPAEEEPLVDPPRPGDTIEHPSFGVCTVEKLEDDEDFILVRTPQNRLLRLSLDVLRPALLSTTDGRRAFRSRPRGARR